MAFAGWLTIGTRVDNSKFDKQMAKIEKDIESAEQKKLDIEVDLKNYEEESQKLDALREKKKQLEKQLADAKSRETFAQSMAGGSQEVQMLQSQLESVTAQLEQQSIAHDKNTNKIAQEERQYQGLNEKISEGKAKIESIDLKKHQSEVDGLKNKFNDVGKSIQGSVKNIGRMIIGIFGIRSAYMMLRQASSTLAQYDTQYAANLEYIRWALAQAVAPVLRYIVSLAATLLNYIISIMQTIFPLFKNVDLSAKSFNKMKAGAGGVAKAAKEINKQLAGFDEMNILQDTSSSGGGGGAGGSGPSFDLSGMQGDVPKWLQWIIDNKDLILSIIAGVVAGIEAFKLGLSGLQALGIGIAIAGIVYAVQGLIAYLKDPSFENFGKIITGIAVAVAGVAIAFGAWPVAIGAAVVAVFGVIVSHWEQISSFLQEKIAWVESILNGDEMAKWAEETFGPVAGPIVDLAKQGMNIVKSAFNYVDKQIQAAKRVFDGLITFIKGIIKGFKEGDWSQAWEGIKEIALGVWDGIKSNAIMIWEYIVSMIKGVVDILQIIFTGLVDFIVEIAKFIWKSIVTDPINQFKEIFTTIKNWLVEKFTELGTKISNKVAEIKTKFTDLWDSFKNKASQAWENVKNVFSNVGTFFGNIWNTIKSKFTDIGQKVGNAIGGAFKSAINSVLSAAQRVINGPINAINRLISIINAVPGISLGRLATISLPRLATGGIINMPNRGVNIGGAIAGESGREGILPLTDTRAMQVLGEEIGKWITINANIVNEMDGKVLSRQVRRIQTQEDFAFNS